MPAYISIVCMCKSIHIIIGAHTNEQRYCLAKTNHICIYMYIYIYIKQTIYKQYIYIYISTDPWEVACKIITFTCEIK